MSRRYKCEDGSYLFAHCDGEETWRILWYDKENDDDGLVLGQCPEDADVDPEKGVDWEVCVTEKVMKEMGGFKKDADGYRFASKREAQKVLEILNTALLSGKKPWPAWALQAKAAGWTEPKGWTP